MKAKILWLYYKSKKIRDMVFNYRNKNEEKLADRKINGQKI